ncbi:MAG: efflux RND transporter periplasmic adaptor subunit [Pseudomonadota bacterium]
MNPKQSRRLIVAAVIATVIAIAWYSSRPEAIAVTAAAIETGMVEKSIANTRAGTVKTCRRARLAPLSGGQVEQLLVKKGQKVKAGQPLLQLWNKDLEAKLQLAQSEARTVEAQREQACLKAENAQNEWQRISNLYQRKLASEEQRDKSRSVAQISDAACRAAEAKVQVSADQIQLAESLLERSLLTAPFDGVVAEINGEPGEVVTPSPPGIPTPPAVDIIDADCLYAAAPIDEVDAPQVEICLPVRITLDAFPDHEFNGQVRRIAPYVLDVEKQARTVEVEVFFSDPEQIKLLLPGYSADVEIILESHDNVLRIPSEALVDENKVYLITEDNHLIERTVEIGLSNWRYTEIISGLTTGDSIVTSPNREGLADGVLVTIEAEEP